MSPRRRPGLDVVVETGTKRVFASVVGWPGWCRSARTEQAALEQLADYCDRYRRVAGRAGLDVPAADVLAVVERVPGNATTDFGAPGAVADVDRRPLDAAGARRQASLVTASWAELDAVAAGAPQSLRKGPRGGGRDRDAVVAHVKSAEAAYARKVGVRVPESALATDTGLAGFRAALVDVLSAATDGEPVVDRGWPSAYATRRIAWHVLDHAWEIEDRSEG